MVQDHAIEITDLSKRFKQVEAVKHLFLNVPRGSIFAFIGPNAAGKTTTIKMLMNLIKPQSGSSSVLGVASNKLGPKEWQRIGYVSENQQLPKWMTVEQLLAYCAPMYPTWDKEFCQKMQADFNLPVNQKLKHLSRGNLMKAALLSSLAYRPELLVLDEPFTGLDPLVRDELVEGILNFSKEEQWTIFISSHDIHEVERLADWVGFIENGSLQIMETTETLQNHYKRVDVVLDSPAPIPKIKGGWPEKWLQVQQNGRMLFFFHSAYQENTCETEVKKYFPNCKYIDVCGLSLRDIFISWAKKNRETALK